MSEHDVLLVPEDASDDPRDKSSVGGLTEAWARIQAALRERVQPEQFETWFRRATLTRLDEETFEVSVLNRFSKDWLENYYRQTLEGAALFALGDRRRLVIKVDAELSVREAPRSPAEGMQRVTAAPPERVGEHPLFAAPHADVESQPASEVSRKIVSPVAQRKRSANTLLGGSDVELNPRYVFDGFVVGPCNRFGHAAALGAAEQPGSAYNPFFLHGQVGVGKTHLLQAVCHFILDRTPESRILYLSCETFVNHFISALDKGDITAFRNKYRNVDVLVVDDIHLLANKERTQEEFFHTFNTLYNAGKQIVLSSDSPPKDIPTLQERLVSRFKWGMVTEIEPPCLETRMAIIKRKSRDQGSEFPDDVTALIAENLADNVRELEGAVIRLIGYSSLTGSPITVQLALETLKDVFQVRRGEATMEDILNATTSYFSVKLSDLQSKRRTNAIAYPRQISMFIARTITRHTYGEIGGYFGGRDHSTVLYACTKIAELYGNDTDCKRQVDDLLQRLGASR